MQTFCARMCAKIKPKQNTQQSQEVSRWHCPPSKRGINISVENFPTSPPVSAVPLSSAPPHRPCWGRGWDQGDQPWASPSSSRASSSSPKERQSFITAEDKTGAVGEQRAAQRPPPASCGDFPPGETWCTAFVLDSNFFFSL